MGSARPAPHNQTDLGRPLSRADLQDAGSTVVLSIGTCRRDMNALKRLVACSAKNRFYRANRDLGRVFKTEFLLSYLSERRWCMNRNWPATNPTHRSITYQERTRFEYRRCPPRRPFFDGTHAAIASSFSQIVTSPRLLRPRSYSLQFRILYFVLYWRLIRLDFPAAMTLPP